MKKKVVNAMEVARLAGVSQSTVSRVFSPSTAVSEKTRHRVWKAAEELGYRPNALARGLIMNKTKIIGLIIRDIQNLCYPEILDKFIKGLRAKGYHVLLAHTENNEVNQDEVYQFLEYNVDGIIVIDTLLSLNTLAHLSKYNIPIILFNQYTEASSCSYHFVGCDNYAAGKDIGEYLLKQGHHQYACITGHRNGFMSHECEKGFRQVFQQRGIKTAIEAGDGTYEGGYKAAMRLLKGGSPPDAIFCASDLMALGAADAARSLNLSIPEHVSIVGFNDSVMASLHPYSLTTWRQPFDELIAITIKTLLDDIDGRIKSPVSILLCGVLIKRDSVRASHNTDGALNSE
ncbi:LacI family transcriptional regulator [Ectobacillus funiculus]|uniref:LacI family DNA-binding transcriptional regulator n=1 Tax=Ectobacillus funiculus TaxID=137993 RepID=UPI00397ACA9A